MRKLPILLLLSLIMCACWSGKDKSESEKSGQDSIAERLRKEDSIKTEKYNDSINSLYYYVDVCNVIHEDRYGCLTLIQMDFNEDPESDYITSSRIAGLKLVNKDDIKTLRHLVNDTNLLFCKYCFRTKEYIRLMDKIKSSKE